jgi:hypothetical protein
MCVSRFSFLVLSIVWDCGVFFMIWVFGDTSTLCERRILAAMLASLVDVGRDFAVMSL